MKRCIRFFSILSLLVTSACSFSNRDAVDASHMINPEKGLILTSLTQTFSNRTESIHAAMEVLVQYNDVNDPENNWGVIRTDYQQTSPYKGRGDFQNPDGKLFLIEVPPGTYSITGPSSFLIADISYKPVPDTAHTITVKAGKVTYIGEYRMDSAVSSSSLFDTDLTNVRAITKDSRERDIREALKKYPNLKQSDFIYDTPPSATRNTEGKKAKPPNIQIRRLP